MIDKLDTVAAHAYGLDERHLIHIFETFHEGWDNEERQSSVLGHSRTWTDE